MPHETPQSVVLPELQELLQRATIRRCSQTTSRLARRWAAGVAAAMTVGVAGVAAAGVLPGQLTPQQAEAQRVVGSQSARALAALPAVTLADLSGSQRRLLDFTVGDLGLSQTGRRLGGDVPVYVFSTDDGRYCLIEPSGASCANLDQLSPHFTFGYDPKSGESSVTVVALGDVAQIRATTDDGHVHRFDVADGAETFRLTGQLASLKWLAAGQSFEHAVPVDISTPDR